MTWYIVRIEHPTKPTTSIYIEEVTGGMEMIALDSTPAIIATLEADNPAEAGLKAWKKGEEVVANRHKKPLGTAADLLRALLLAPGVTRTKLYLYWHEYKSMPEYASSTPTGQTPGKVWRGRLEWMQVSMYTHVDDELAYMLHFNVVLREGPQPPGYAPPDWDNYEHWKKLREERRKTNVCKASSSTTPSGRASP